MVYLKLSSLAFLSVLVSAPVLACIVMGGGSVYLNKPNVTVNISEITSNANLSYNYTAVQGGVAFRSHHNGSLVAVLARDSYGWSLRIGVPEGESGPADANYSEAVWTELDWLWNHKVVNGTTPGDVSEIVDLLANSTASYVYWKDGNWTAIQNNCYPDGTCARCGPAGAALNATLPPLALDLPEKTDDEKINECVAGLGLVLLFPLGFALRRQA
ncbi:MAG: hypothetical protein PHF51_01575 [Candidatus ainarchaeum sp.]|nr:hypothetical protein [Candidatus ainarchaeum sp.]